MRGSKWLFIAMGFHASYICCGQVIETRMYPFNYAYFNPAFASEENRLTIGGGFEQKDRDQGIYGILSYEGFVKKINTGVGFIGYSRSNYSPEGSSSFGFYINHKFDLKKGWFLNIGTKIQWQQVVLDFSRFRSTDPIDPILNAPVSSAASNWFTDLGFQVIHKNSYFGLSSINLFGQSIGELGGIAPSSPQASRKVYNGILGTKAKFGSSVDLDVSIFATYVEQRVYTEANSILTLHNWIVTGLGYAINDNEIRTYVGANMKKWGKIVFLIYRSEGLPRDFRTELLMQLKF